MVAEAAKAFGRIDILVNNAGCNVRKPAVDVTWDDWNLILDTNLRGAFFVAQSVATGDDSARLRPHHQYRLGDVGDGIRRARPVRREPRRHQATDDEPRRRLGSPRHHGELPGARMVQDRAEQGDVRGCRSGSPTSSIAFRCDGRERWAISKGRWCFSRRTRASTSPDRRCSSTAASRQGRRGRCRRNSPAKNEERVTNRGRTSGTVFTAGSLPVSLSPDADVRAANAAQHASVMIAPSTSTAIEDDERSLSRCSERTHRVFSERCSVLMVRPPRRYRASDAGISVSSTPTRPL